MVPPQRTTSANYFAIFKDESSNNTQVVAVRPGVIYSTSDFAHLKFVNDATVAFIQKRTADGHRETISPRGRIGWIRYLDNLSAENLLSASSSFSKVDQEKAAIALGMATWIRDSRSQDSVMRILTEIYEAENTRGISPIETFYGDLTLALPEGFNLNNLTYNQSSVITERSAFAEFLKSGDKEFDYIWRSIDEFIAVNNTAIGRHRIYHQGLPIDFELDFIFEQPLLVALHGRKAPKVKLPYLAGAGITGELPVSRLSISDPSLYLDYDLSIAWYAGNQYQSDLQATLSKLINFIQLKVEAPRSILFGGSAGGFAALVLSHSIKDSVAVVWNPQTDFTRYYHRFYDDYISTCWPDGFSSIPENLIISAVELYKNSDSLGNKILYLQEKTDSHHVENHLKPFLAAVKRREKLLLLQQNWAEGHAPPPRNVLKKVVSIACDTNCEISALNYGFQAP